MTRMRALSIKQPFAEQVLRGTKKFGYRSRPTAVGGRVYVYAGLKPRHAADSARMVSANAAPPLGMIVGTGEVVDSKRPCAGEYGWALTSPKRLQRPNVPMAHPPLVWFSPFGR